jgi:hypothetical protein
LKRNPEDYNNYYLLLKANKIDVANELQFEKEIIQVLEGTLIKNE